MLDFTLPGWELELTGNQIREKIPGGCQQLDVADVAVTVSFTTHY